MQSVIARTFITSGIGGIGIEFLALSGGVVILADPKGQEHRFQYRAAGFGLSAGVKKIHRIGPLDVSRIDPRNMSEHGSGNISPESF